MKRKPKHWYSAPGSWLKQRNHWRLVTFVIVFGAIGSILLFGIHAATSIKTPIQGLFDRGSLGNISDNNGANYSLPTNSDASALNGVVANVSWAQLQSTNGGPINSTNQLNTVLTKVAAYNQANNTNLQVKVRIFAGIYAPDWAKNIDGWKPVNICNTQTTSACGTIGPFWTADYDTAFKNFMTAFANATDSRGYTYDSDPLLHDVTISQCMTVFAEPFQRDDSGLNGNGDLGDVLYYPTSGTSPYAQPTYTGQAYSVNKDENCLEDQIVNSEGWKHTHLSLSFNPFKPWTNATTQSNSPGESFTYSVMQLCRTDLGNQCTIENNSIRQTFKEDRDQTKAGNLYYDITNEGPDITFQTASQNGVGNLNDTVSWAAQIGANAVELPAGYDNDLTFSQTVVLSTALLANPSN